jgi:hypothetical protein
VLLQRGRSLRHYLVADDRQAVLDLLLRHEVARIVGVAAIRTICLLGVRDTCPGLYLEELLARDVSAFATDVSICTDGDRKGERSCFAQWRTRALLNSAEIRAAVPLDDLFDRHTAEHVLSVAAEHGDIVDEHDPLSVRVLQNARPRGRFAVTSATTAARTTLLENLVD